MDPAEALDDRSSRAPRGRRPDGSLLVDRDLAAALGRLVTAGDEAAPIAADQVQAASLDLRLGSEAHRIRAGFLPGRAPLKERLAELSTNRVDLRGEGGVLERGLVYLVRLEERIELPEGLRAGFNPRSSTGRCDVFTRVLVPGHPRFNEAPPGYAGPLWLEVSPLSFPMRFRRGDRLCQLRLERGNAGLAGEELRGEYERAPLCYRGAEAVPVEEVRFDGEGGLELTLGLLGRDPAGWRARTDTAVVEFSRDGGHEPGDFFEPIRAPEGRCILSPGGFHLFASRERVAIPPHLAAEMVPVDVGIGELRNNYAGFFDNGFGWTGAGEIRGLPGTPAVLEVRAHDVPFLVDEGQVFFRLRFFRTEGVPDRLYGEGREGVSYQDQDLTLARAFRAPGRVGGA